LGCGVVCSGTARVYFFIFKAGDPMSTTTQVMSGACGAQLRRLFLAGSSLMALTGSTLAADLPVAKAPPPAVMASWAGFYLGAHGGYGWKHDDFSQASNFILEAG
jgi:hypothetical protein